MINPSTDGQILTVYTGGKLFRTTTAEIKEELESEGCAILEVGEQYVTYCSSIPKDSWSVRPRCA